MHFLTSVGTAFLLKRIFQVLSLKLLNNVKLGWWFYLRNSSLPDGPCWVGGNGKWKKEEGELHNIANTSWHPLAQCRDVDKWSSLWHILALSDSRIDVEDWTTALQLFSPTNALKYNLELEEVKFREEIVEAMGKLVSPRTQLEDSYIQKRSRLCKVIYERIRQSKVSLLYGVHVVGLYGFSSIGRTTLCQARCYNFFKGCRGKVAHMELGSQSEEDLLKQMLRRLTDMNLDYLGAMNVDEYQNCLKRDMMNVKVFLTIDNVSSATSKQALILLQANYGLGSVLLVTARSLNELLSLRMVASECIEMPELEMEEARSTFVICLHLYFYFNRLLHPSRLYPHFLFF